MRRFFSKFALFAAPFVLFYGLVGGLALRTGEALPYRIVNAMQQANHELVYYLQDNSGNFVYKAINLQDRAPDVVLMGSSRTQQFRAAAYNRQPEAFYNAGLNGSHLAETQALFRYIDWDNPPEIIILILDQENFLDGAIFERHDVGINQKTMNSERFTIGLANTFLALMERPNDVTIGELFAARNPASDEQAIGIAAITFGMAYRYDGSGQLGDTFVAAVERRFDNHWAKFAAREQMFMTGTDVSSLNIRRIETMLQQAADHDVTVIGIYPPFAPSFYDAMQAADEDFAYMDSARAELATLFASYDYPFLDYLDSAALGATDADFYDSYHPSELFALQIHLDMVQQLPDLFAPYVDTAALTELVNHPLDSMNVFPQ